MGKDWDGADGFRRSLNGADAGRDSVFGRTSRTGPEYRTGRGARVLADRAGELTPRGERHSTSAGPYLATGVDSVRVAGPPFQTWCHAWATEALRVLKPGGHMLAFGGTRTWHRLACGVEDAGFEIRDSIAWVYGQGFPKSLDVGKSLDDWQGWGTALKPAHEPILVARRPLAGTVAGNVLAHGTGALNIDGCRVEGAPPSVPQPKFSRDMVAGFGASDGRNGDMSQAAGRWPPNVLLDEAAAAELDRQSGNRPGFSGGGTRGAGFNDEYVGGSDKGWIDESPTYFSDTGGASRFFPRFLYEAKAPGVERPRGAVGEDDEREAAHPTVKPLALMRWLVRLVTPPGGTVLDPFAGSGTTVEAAMLEGAGSVVAVEQNAAYLPMIEERVGRVRDGFVLALHPDGATVEDVRRLGRRKPGVGPARDTDVDGGLW